MFKIFLEFMILLIILKSTTDEVFALHINSKIHIN